MRILIVEDEPLLALDLEDLLESLGHKVVGIAATAVEAEALLGDLGPDLVMIDINIRGDRNGIEVARSVRARSGAEIAFATAHADSHHLAQMQALSPAGVLTKPYDYQRIGEVLRAVDRGAAASPPA